MGVLAEADARAVAPLHSGTHPNLVSLARLRAGGDAPHSTTEILQVAVKLEEAVSAKDVGRLRLGSLAAFLFSG
jgi:hypothetical protein